MGEPAAPYTGLKKSLADRFTFFDAGALDTARFLYGHPTPQVETFAGTSLVDEWLTRQAEQDAFAAFDAATAHSMTMASRMFVWCVKYTRSVG